MTPEAISAFLNQTITSRIGIRLIAEQFVSVSRVALIGAAEGDIKHVPGGIIDTECSPERMVRMCAAFVSSLCDASFGASPEIRIDGIVDAKFAYVILTCSHPSARMCH